MFRFFYLIPVIVIWSCKTPKQVKPLEAKHALVVSARAEASQIGIQILKQGGNAFDAMIATELALAVAYPFAGNLGGGGFMVYRTAKGEIGSLDYREKAPIKAKQDMFLDSLGEVIPKLSTQSGLAIGVPGTVAGVWEVHQRFGSLPWQDILKPVIALAQKGVVVTPKQAERLQWHRAGFEAMNGPKTFFAHPYKAGDTIKYDALAQTLKVIQALGAKGFYEGEVAKTLVDFLATKGALITLEDLKQYRAIWRAPIVSSFQGLKIISMGPPSSGGITLSQILKMIEPYQLKQWQPQEKPYIQLLVEAQ